MSVTVIEGQPCTPRTFAVFAFYSFQGCALLSLSFAFMLALFQRPGATAFLLPLPLMVFLMCVVGTNGRIGVAWVAGMLQALRQTKD